MDELLRLMAALRHPETGCAWDIKQTPSSIAPYALEEAYELVDAIASHDINAIQEELGDVLLQVVFHARLFEEQGAFTFADVLETLCAKLIRRHPHIFGETKNLSPDEVKRQWEAIKRSEKQAVTGKFSLELPTSALDAVPASLSPVLRAEKLSRKAAKVGFDWPDITSVFDKIEEEIGEVKNALASGDQAEITDEIGDLLFAVINLARKANVSPDYALTRTNQKFERRFRTVESALAEQGLRPEEASLGEMEALWRQAKS